MTMEKYGVDLTEDESDDENDPAHAGALGRVCEKCGRVLVDHGRTQLCPEHGVEWRVRE